MAKQAGKLLDLHWTSVYRLRTRFLAHPVASAVRQRERGPKSGQHTLDPRIEAVITEVIENWLPKQQALAAPMRDLTTEIEGRCRQANLKARGRNTVARRWAESREEVAAALAARERFQRAPGSFEASRPLEMVQAERVNDFAPRVVMNLLCRAVSGRRWRSPFSVG